jgi:hypothetical protein
VGRQAQLAEDAQSHAGAIVAQQRELRQQAHVAQSGGSQVVVRDVREGRVQTQLDMMFDPLLLLSVRSTPMTSSGAAGSQPDSAQAVALTPAMHASRIAGAALRPARASTITPRS